MILSLFFHFVPIIDAGWQSIILPIQQDIIRICQSGDANGFGTYWLWVRALSKLGILEIFSRHMSLAFSMGKLWIATLISLAYGAIDQCLFEQYSGRHHFHPDHARHCPKISCASVKIADAAEFCCRGWRHDNAGRVRHKSMLVSNALIEAGFAWLHLL